MTYSDMYIGGPIKPEMASLMIAPRLQEGRETVIIEVWSLKEGGRGGVENTLN